MAKVKVTVKPEEDEVPAAEAKKGRPRNNDYLPWEEAREFIRGEMIPSRGKFFDWWDANKPKTIPHFPYRVYKEWVSWNDFLGTNNKFNEKIHTKWKPLLEATLFVHALKIKTSQDWMEWCKVDGNLPFDIPARPDLVYNDWRSWNHWLGNKPQEAIEVRKEAAKIQVYYILHEPGTPQNVLWFGIDPTLNSVKERWERNGWDIVKLFWWDNEKANVVKNIIDSLSVPYQESNSQRMVPNIWEIIWHLSFHLNVVTHADTI